MANWKIVKLEDIFKLPKTKRIINHETKQLTEAGENYGSLMLAVTVTIKDLVNDGEEIVEIVAKMPPPSEFLREHFNSPVTFFQEIGFYKTIVPKMEEVWQQNVTDTKFDCFPKLLGARMGLNSNHEFDEFAVILLENLKILGYKTLNRSKGFDLETSKMILKTLARFHAIPLAIKQSDPEDFENVFKPFFGEYSVFKSEKPESVEIMKEQIKEILCESKLDSISNEKVMKVINNNLENGKALRNSSRFIREPFATLVHSDLWVNNIMVKSSNNQPTGIKFVDFQIYEYGSPLHDLMRFVFTSVQLPVLKQNLDYLIDFYYKELIQSLKMLNCKIEAFSWEIIQQEIKDVIWERELYHCIGMLNLIYMPKDNCMDVHDSNEPTFVEKIVMPDEQMERAKFLIKTVCERSWI